MALRAKVHKDYTSIRRSRRGYNGAITKVTDKLAEMAVMDPETLNTRSIETLLSSVSNTETRYHNTIEEAEAFLLDQDDAEVLLDEEASVIELFEHSVAAARQTAEELIDVKGAATMLRNFHKDTTDLKEAHNLRPEADHSSALKILQNSYTAVRTKWDSGCHEGNHALQRDLDRGGSLLSRLACEMAGNREVTPVPARDRSFSSIATTDAPRRMETKLPNIEIPQFHGDIMKWATFWAAFQAAVGERESLSNSTKLSYLRRAIQDPECQILLTDPREGEDSYDMIVAELHALFDRTKEVHRNLVQQLIGLTPIKETRTEIRRLMTTVRSLISSLKRTGTYCLDTFLTSILYALVPTKMKTLWEQHTKGSKKVTEVQEMLAHFAEHAETLPSPPFTQEKKESTDRRPPFRQQEKKKGNHAHQAQSTQPSYKWECQLCPGDNHPLYVCSKWLGYALAQRTKYAKDKELCTNCLSIGHATATCRSKYRCKECQKAHHTTLHVPTAPVTNHVHATRHHHAQLPDALTMTARINLTGPGGRTITARALLDSGAGLSLVSARVSQLLDLKLRRTEIQLSGVQGTRCKPIKHVTQLFLSPIQTSSPSIEVTAAVVSQVTNDLPAQDVSAVTTLSHISPLNLADPQFSIPGRIDILLGADVYGRLLGTSAPITGTSTGVRAVDTIFGWAIMGPIPVHAHTVQVATASQDTTSQDTHLDEQLAKFWDSEQIHTGLLTHTSVEEQVQFHYSNTTSYSPHAGRYTVSLPRNPEVPALGESRSQALSRYMSNEKSIIRRNIWEPFQAVVQGYLDLGHAELISPVEPTPPVRYYLPMHSVTKQSSTSTKLRVVFDGSATTDNGISLNRSLLVGPTLHPNLGAILTKFRTYPVAITADISKMYREVALISEDKDLHRFLWRATPDETIKDYRMTRVTFGVSASPYLAVRTLQQTARDHGDGYSEAVQHILNSFYVDDLLAGADTPEDALRIHRELRAILIKGGFNLCKWRSSSQTVLQSIPTHLQESIPVKEMAESHDTNYPRALGLEWNSRLDLMAPAIQPPTHYNTTKRGIVSDVSKTFDILGWIAPAVLLMKLLYQQLWLLKSGWDDQVPKDLVDIHATWRIQLPVLASKQLPRCYYHLTQPPLTKEIHGFADASIKAYGAVIYVRSTYTNHSPIVSLVTSKTRVAKMTLSTVPRQELCAAVLLTELLTEVKKILDIPDNDVHCWSDSSIVLSWLDGHARDYRIFITNRINRILQVTTPQSWKHIPTAENPADCASRGLMPEDLLNHSLWWDGPALLQEEPIAIPPQPPRKPLSAPEFRKTHQIHIAHVTTPPFLEDRYASYYKIISITAWCLRFKHQASKQKEARPDHHLTTAELHQAEHRLVLLSQERSFPKDRHTLLLHKTLAPSSRLLALNPYLDEENLLRVGGRLSNSALTLSQKHPLIVDASDILVNRLCLYLHTCLGHCGPTLLLASLSRRFHVINARKLTRSICRQCTICRRASPRTQHQLMGELPTERVSTTPAFTTTGIDYAGPFTLKKGHTRKPVHIKAYLALFVCTSTKAVHLELVSDLTTIAFLAALRRFVSRRGCPTTIHSDNGTNFVGARNQLHQLYAFLRTAKVDASIHNHLLTQRITWHTLPERAPHFGGLWEAAVKSAKYHLKRVVGTQILTYEELSTVSTQVEACLNSRPLTTMTSHDSDGLTPLTPGHFLLLKPPTAYPEYPGLPEEPCKLKKWHLCQSIVQHFWDRWSREYLQSLQTRTKWKTAHPNFQVDDIVILKEDKTFSCHWPIARIIETYPGKDGLVRVVRITTGTATYKRPITKLALLHREDSRDIPDVSSPPQCV